MAPISARAPIPALVQNKSQKVDPAPARDLKKQIRVTSEEGGEFRSSQGTWISWENSLDQRKKREEEKHLTVNMTQRVTGQESPSPNLAQNVNMR